MKKKLIKTAHLDEEKPQIQKPTNLLQDSSSEDSDQQENKKENFTRFQILDENKQQQGQLDRFLQKGKSNQTAPQPKKQKVIEFKMIEETKQPTIQKEEEKRCDLSDSFDSDFDLPTFKHLAGITRTSTNTTQTTQLLKAISQSSENKEIILNNHIFKKLKLKLKKILIKILLINLQKEINIVIKCFLQLYYVLGNFEKYQREQIIQIIRYYGGYHNCRVLKDTILVQGDSQNNGKNMKESQHFLDAKKYNSLILDFDGFNNHLISYTGNDISKSFQLAYQDNPQNVQEIKEQSDQQSKQNIQQSQILQKSLSQQQSKLPTNQPIQEVKSNLRAKFDSEVVIVEKQVELKPEIVNFSKNKQIQEDQKKVQKIEQIMVEDTKQKCQLWTNKYAPSKVSDCLDQTHVINIVKWLDKWGKSQLEICPGSFQSQNFAAKALLLSGPPGIGKTTIIRLIAKQKSYQLIEWNASDVRSMI